jgi:hypothetical protein
MFVEILQNEQLAALREAFNRACAELGLGMSAEDIARREHLAVFMLIAAKAGERDTSVILVKAVQPRSQTCAQRPEPPRDKASL